MKATEWWNKLDYSQKKFIATMYGYEYWEELDTFDLMSLYAKVVRDHGAQ